MVCFFEYLSHLNHDNYTQRNVWHLLGDSLKHNHVFLWSWPSTLACEPPDLGITAIKGRSAVTLVLDIP